MDSWVLRQPVNGVGRGSDCKHVRRWGLLSFREQHGRHGARAALEWIVLVGVMFGYAYNLVFQMAPVATSGRLALLVLVMAFWRQGLNVGVPLVRQCALVVIVTFGVIVYGLIQWGSGGDTVLALRAFYLLSYTAAGATLWVAVSQQRGWSLEALFGAATCFQGMLVIYSLVTPAFRQWLPTVLVPLGNLSLEDSIRPPGFTNGGGAALSVVQGLGVYATLTVGERLRGIPRITWHVAAILCLISAWLTGRTGFLLGLGMCLVVLVSGTSRYRGWMVRFGVFFALIALALGPIVQSQLQESVPGYARLQDWAIEFFVSGINSSSVENLRSQPIPPLSLETVVGTGRTVEPDQTNASGSDSGYIQTYYALGFPMTIIWYGLIFGTLLRLAWRSGNRFRLVALTASLSVLEVKEPFTFKWIVPFLILALSTVSSPVLAAPSDTRRRNAAAAAMTLPEA